MFTEPRKKTGRGLRFIPPYETQPLFKLNHRPLRIAGLSQIFNFYQQTEYHNNKG